MADIISFPEFGSLIFEQLATPELVKAVLGTALPRRIWVDVPGWAAGWAETEGVVSMPQREIRDCEIAFHLQLGLTLNVGTPLGNLPPVRAKISVTPVIKFYAPLLLFVELETVTPEAFSFEYAGNIIDKVLIEQVIPRVVADQVNKQVAENESLRLIDLEAVFLELTSKDSSVLIPVSPNTVDVDPKDDDALLPRDALAAFTLGAGKSIEGLMLLGEGERLQVLIYGQQTDIPGMAFSHGANCRFFLKGDEKWDDAEWSSVNVDEGAWGRDWAKNVFPDDKEWFTRPKSGWYRFRLTSETTSSTCRFLLKQKRERDHSTLRRKLLTESNRICFDQLGRNIMQIGVSPEFVRRMGSSRIRQMGQQGKLKFPWKDSPLGEVMLEALPEINKVSAVNPAQPDFQVLRQVDVKAVIRGNREEAHERLFSVPVRAVVTLSLGAAKNPLEIQIGFEHLTEFTINAEKLEVINEHAEKILRRLLETTFAEKFKELLIEFINQHFQSQNIMSLVLSKVIDDATHKAAPQTEDPAPPVFAGLEIKQYKIMAGQAEYHPIKLRKGQKISVSAKVRPIRAPGIWGIPCSLAVCDQLHGVMARKDLNLPAGKTAQRSLSLTFTAAEAGEYSVRVRPHPIEGEDYIGLTYDLNIK
ncbi:MAG TPA: hypothetical protein VF723_00455 [Pyrinomonadaceae bacterium]|jgi:hypothetical protein